MISDALLMYLLGQIILLIVNLLGMKMPLMAFIGIVGSIILVTPTIESFEEYYPVALILILVNIILPTMAIFGYQKNR